MSDLVIVVHELVESLWCSLWSYCALPWRHVLGKKEEEKSAVWRRAGKHNDENSLVINI